MYAVLRYIAGVVHPHPLVMLFGPLPPVHFTDTTLFYKVIPQGLGTQSKLALFWYENSKRIHGLKGRAKILCADLYRDFTLIGYGLI